MKLKKLLSILKFKMNDNTLKFVNSSLCGVPLRTIAGTIRNKEDQDDAWWFYLAKHHDRIFDIGANIGYTALLALIEDPDKTIVLVDPNPKALQKAAINLLENDLGRKAHFKTAFVGATNNDTVKFYTIGAGAAGSMYASHAETAASAQSFMNVNTVTLDTLSESYNILPDLVKIDVEGAETQVMQAAKILASKAKCSFFIEMHNVEGIGMATATQMMLDWCEEMNYNTWYLKEGTLITTPEKTKDRGKCHLLLLPKERDYPHYLDGIGQNAPLPKILNK